MTKLIHGGKIKGDSLIGRQKIIECMSGVHEV
jgi:hypothetical protein